jgi:putative DNA primase/helicase
MAVSSAVKCIHVGPGHVETPNLYLFAPLLSGERKTGMVGAATAPLYEWETEQAEFKADEIRAAQSRRKTQEKIIEGMRNKAAKTSDDEERRALIESIAAQEVALEDIPHLPRLLADDATPESLPRILKAQGEVLGIISSEGGIFDIFGGRYSRDGIPNLDLLLKAHNGESYRVDRIGRDPIVLNNPRLEVCICPQPDVLLSMADKPGFRGRGLLARFLYLFSESQVGYRNISPDPMPGSVTREYSTRIKALLDMRGANLELTISPTARALWLQFAQAVEEQMRPGGEFEHFRDWAGKLPGQAARLAGVFHCIEAQLPGSLTVTEDTMSRALSLAALLADHAKMAFSTMGSDPATEAAKSILDWIQRKKRDKFTLRDCFRDLAGRYKNTSEMKPGLSVLTERGYIKDIGMEQTGGKGRPKGPYFVANPIVIGGGK